VTWTVTLRQTFLLIGRFGFPMPIIAVPRPRAIHQHTSRGTIGLDSLHHITISVLAEEFFIFRQTAIQKFI
jgi:hypothetical protein